MRILSLLCLALPLWAQAPARLLGSVEVRCLARTDDSVWAGTAQGLYRIRRHSIDQLFPDRSIEALAVEPDGTVHAACGGEVLSVGPAPRRAPFSTARQVKRAGYVWTATAKGIERHRIERRLVQFSTPGTRRIHALAAGPDGAIWCGTHRGVARYRDGSLQMVNDALGAVTALAVDREGRVWIGSGSDFAGVYRYESQRFKAVPGIDAYVHSIGLDSAGTLWFAALNAPRGSLDAGRGAWYFDGRQFRRPAGLGARRVYDIAARDRAGVVWFATLRGLVALQADGKLTEYTPQSGELGAQKVWCLRPARDGSLWLGYQRGLGGASRLARGKFSHFAVEDGLASNEVWSIAEGRPGVFWFATRNGLSRYDGRRWSTFRFTRRGLWPLLPTDDGSLWIGSLGDGLWRLRPDDNQPPKTTVERSGRKVQWRASDAWFDTPADRIWYRYRVNGGPWSKGSPERELRLAEDSEARTIEVQAIDLFGNAESPPARLEIEGTRSYPIELLALVAAALGIIAVLVWKRGS